MNARSVSVPNPIYASQSVAFLMTLMFQSQKVLLQDYDISVEVYTSQMSPRKSVQLSKSEAEHSDATVLLKRWGDQWGVQFEPDWLKDFPTGVLTLTCRYRSDRNAITNVVKVGKFINDYPANSDKVVQ